MCPRAGTGAARDTAGTRGGPSLARMDRLDLATGRRTPLVQLGADRPSGRIRLAFATLADNPRVYAYVAEDYLSSLFTVDGVR